MTIILQITAALISAVADEGQRTELGQKYDALRGELEAAERESGA